MEKRETNRKPVKCRDKTGRFPKGISGNPNGRPKGTRNRTTLQLQNALKAFIDANLDNLQKQYNQIEPLQKLIFFEKLLKYIMPAKTQVDFNKLAPEDIEEIISQILNRDE